MLPLFEISKDAVLEYVGLTEVRTMTDDGRMNGSTAIYYRAKLGGVAVRVWPPHFELIR